MPGRGAGDVPPMGPACRSDGPGLTWVLSVSGAWSCGEPDLLGRSMLAPTSGRSAAARRASATGDAGDRRESDAGEGSGSDFVRIVDAGSPGVAPVVDAGDSWLPVPGGIVGAGRAVRGSFISDWPGAGRRATSDAGSWDETDPAGRSAVVTGSAESGTGRGIFSAGGVASEPEEAGFVDEPGAVRISVVGAAVGVGRAVATTSRSDPRQLSCGSTPSGETTI